MTSTQVKNNLEREFDAKNLTKIIKIYLHCEDLRKNSTGKITRETAHD